MGKRWGKKFVDNRNWVDYNEELVLRGTFYLDLEWVSGWDGELKAMNCGKCGAPYEFPESLIKLQAVWNQFLDCRGVEGVTRQLAELKLIPKFNDFTTVWRRVRKTSVGIVLPDEDDFEVGCDGTGMKIGSAGEYKHQKYFNRTRRKFVKVTISATTKGKLLCVDACIDGAGDSEPEIAVKHLDELKKNGKRVRKFYGDGAFDVRNLFKKLQEFDIKSAVKIRSNASTKSNGCMRRAREAKAYQSDGYKKWARKRRYGLRWPATEGVFSAVKRKFGENTRSKTRKNKCKEAVRKFWAYDQIATHAKKRIKP